MTAGLTVERYEPIGTGWCEHSEERSQPVSRELLQLPGRRRREELVARLGVARVEHLEANLHGELFFVGTLLPIVYVLHVESAH